MMGTKHSTRYTVSPRVALRSLSLAPNAARDVSQMRYQGMSQASVRISANVALPAREFANAIRHGGSNVLLTLDVEGGEQLAIPKSIQRHPIKGYFEHVDHAQARCVKPRCAIPG